MKCIKSFDLAKAFVYIAIAVSNFFVKKLNIVCNVFRAAISNKYHEIIREGMCGMY